MNDQSNLFEMVKFSGELAAAQALIGVDAWIREVGEGRPSFARGFLARIGGL